MPKQKLLAEASQKLHLGPGGFHCPCCTPFPPAELKRFGNRVFRRKEKQKLGEIVSHPMGNEELEDL